MIRWYVKPTSNHEGLVIPSAIQLPLEVEADIFFSCVAADKLYHSEISGLGRIEAGKESNLLFVSEIIIPFQKCNAGETTILGEVMEAAFDELDAKGKDLSEYNLWWHSHIRGAAWFSSIDEDMINRRLYAMMTTINVRCFASGKPVSDNAVAGPFFSIVGNIYGNMTARCDFLYHCGDDYNQCPPIIIPLKRSLFMLSKEELQEIFNERAPAVMNLVQQRVKNVLGWTREEDK